MRQIAHEVRYLGSTVALCIVAMAETAAADVAFAANGQAIPVSTAQAGSPNLLERPARLSVEGVPLPAALTELHRRAGVPLVFSEDFVSRERRVSCACLSKTVREALDQLLAGTNLQYAHLRTQILIEPVPPHAGVAAVAGRIVASGGRAGSGADGSSSNVLSLEPAELEDLTALAGTVTGRVVEEGTSSPLERAQVFIPGTGIGTVTNNTGTYVLANVPSGEAEVRAELIGYGSGTQTVTVVDGETVQLDFQLGPTAFELEEVVVVGYGTETRRQLSSAIASVGADEFANAPTAGIDAALQGKAAGVQVTQNAGNPGNGITVRVRGPASVNASNQPLYVVDGVPILQDDFTQLGMGGQNVTAVTGINPDDIASIDILKDAAATGIYGSRGSNGVMLITTKRGQVGQSSITFSAYTGWQSTPKMLDLLGAEEYVAIFNESAKNDGYAPEDYDFVPGVDDARTTDWQREVFRTAPVSNLQIGIGGGNERIQYHVSGSYFDQTGIVIGSDYNRAATRINLDFTPSNKLAFRSSVGLARERNKRIEGDGSLDGIVTNAIGMQPMRPVRREDGSFAGQPEGLRYSNPVALAELFSTDLETLRALGNIETDYNFTTEFRLTGRLGMDVLVVDELQWESPLVDRTYAASADGVGKAGHTNASKYLIEGFASFEPRLGAGTLSLVGGASTEFNDSELSFIRGEGFTSGFTKYVRNASIVTEFDGSATEHNLVSFFSRADYSLNDRYLFTASLRADGSSRFGADNRFGVFPAASLAWRISEEPWAEALGRIGDLKLRASFGVTGNQGISDFAALGLAEGLTYGETPGIGASTLANPELRWETTRAFDAGIDLFLLRGRLGIVADYYVRNTSDLLVLRPIPMVSGFSSVWSNIGNVQNRGVELGITTRNFTPARPGGFAWTTELNVSANRNEVTKLYNGEPFTAGIRSTSIITEGHPLGAFSAYAFDGVDPQTGNAIFRDVDGDGDITSADRVVVGDPQPDFYGGLTNQFSFGNLDLRTFVQFSQGNDILNLMRLFTDDGACTYDNKFRDVLDRWQEPGDITDVPRMSYDCASGADVISSRYIEDGSYLRIQEVTLGFRLPDAWAAWAGMDNLRVYVSGHNLHTFTRYTGYHPDVNSSGSGANVAAGTDFFAYPLPRAFSIGVNGAF